MRRLLVYDHGWFSALHNSWVVPGLQIVCYTEEAGSQPRDMARHGLYRCLKSGGIAAETVCAVKRTAGLLVHGLLVLLQHWAAGQARGVLHVDYLKLSRMCKLAHTAVPGHVQC